MSMLKNNRHFVIAIVSSLATAPLYIAMFMLAESPHFKSFLFLMSSLAIVAFVQVFLFLGLWFVFFKIIRVKFHLNESASQIALAVFISIIAVLDALNGLSQLSINMTHLFQILIYLLLSSFAALGSYALALAWQKLTVMQKDRIRLVLLMLPLWALEAMLFVWWQKYTTESLFSLSSFLWKSGLFAGVLAVTALMSFKAAKLLYTLKYHISMLIIILILPFLIWGGKELTQKKAVVSDNHPVKHVILIIIDALRADMLSCYGNTMIQTPNIDQFAHDGWLFTHAYAVAPWTGPSVSSIMTGQSPFVHRATNFHARLSDSFLTLADYFNNDGYRTVGIVSNPILGPARNIGQGFQEYNYFPKPSFPASPLTAIARRLFPEFFRESATSADLTRLSLDWIQKHRQQDYFLWLHYFDPHMPYTPPKKYLPDIRPTSRIGNSYAKPVREVRAGYFVPTMEERDWIKTLYECEVRYVDDQIGILMNGLKQNNLYDDALIVITSDHGEEFWEHGGLEHGHAVYNELLHVPLMIKPAKSTKSGIIEPNVHLCSLVPTILGICGIDCSAGHVVAPSLESLIGHGSGTYSEQPIVATGLYVYDERIAVIDKNYKYIQNTVTGAEELYNVTKDPDEKNSLTALFPDVTIKMRDVISEEIKQAKDIRALYKVGDEKSVQEDKDTLEKLRSLGYAK